MRTSRIEHDDWLYELYSIDHAAEEFPGFEDAVRYWRSLPDLGGIPAWSAFEALDLKSWMGWMSVYFLDYGPPRRLFARLVGSRVAEIIGHDNTGKELIPSTTETTDIRTFLQVDFDFHFNVGGGKIGYREGPTRVELGSWEMVRSVELPFANAGGIGDRVVKFHIFETG